MSIRKLKIFWLGFKKQTLSQNMYQDTSFGIGCLIRDQISLMTLVSKALLCSVSQGDYCLGNALVSNCYTKIIKIPESRAPLLNVSLVGVFCHLGVTVRMMAHLHLTSHSELAAKQESHLPLFLVVQVGETHHPNVQKNRRLPQGD